jgi:methylated-DNA-protein-cysteine methyltransferase-like protein
MNDTFALYEKIYLVTAQIPPGEVATYGDVARVVGGGCDGRTVGEALGALPDTRFREVPWQRVINREGGISLRGSQQRVLLEAEGVEFDADGRVSLVRFRWAGPEAAWAESHACHVLPPHADAEQLRLL